VRRSFNGSYEPIYQCAYMLGARQFRALHKELVGSGKMTNRAFHDAIYREGNIPIEMLRLAFCSDGPAVLANSFRQADQFEPYHHSGPQVIPETVQCALYDLGGDGVAYHDSDPINHGSGGLDHTSDTLKDVTYVTFK
jgi:hypothetical protein